MPLASIVNAVLDFFSWAFGSGWSSISSVIGDYFAAKNSTEKTEADIVASDNSVRAQLVPAYLIHITIIPIFLLIMGPAVYQAVIVFDAVTHLHSTDAIHGDVAQWWGQIIDGLFGFGKVVVASMAAHAIFRK